jgi:hypothetical protein
MRLKALNLQGAPSTTCVEWWTDFKTRGHYQDPVKICLIEREREKEGERDRERETCEEKSQSRAEQSRERESYLISTRASFNFCNYFVIHFSLIFLVA